MENEVVEENEELDDEDEVEEFNPLQSDLMSHLQRVLSKSYCTGICQQKLSLKVCLTNYLFDLGRLLLNKIMYKELNGYMTQECFSTFVLFHKSLLFRNHALVVF